MFLIKIKNYSFCISLLIFCLVLFANPSNAKFFPLPNDVNSANKNHAKVEKNPDLLSTEYNVNTGNLKAGKLILKSTPEDTTMTRRQFKKLFYEATGYFFENHFEQALPPLLDLLRFDPDNSHINFYVGACYMNLPEAKVTPVPFLEKAIKSTTIYYDYDFKSRQAPVFAYFYLAAALRNNYKIEEAVTYNKIFKSYISADNVDLMNEVDTEIKNLENGTYTSTNEGEYTKYFSKPLVGRIEYDVYIRNPEQDINWWVNNLEGIKRELFVNTVLNVAYSGKVNVYDEKYNILTNQQVKAIGNEPTTLRIKTPNPPYNDTLIMVDNQLNRQLITKIRFLEEWYLDDQTMEIGKKVVGLTPLIEEYDEYNSFKGYKPLFTLYFDEKYPDALKTAKDTLGGNKLSHLDSLGIDTSKNKSTDLTVITDYSANTKAQTMLSERIRYDVPVNNYNKSTNKWWIENIAPSLKVNFLKELFDMVGNGIIQAYDGNFEDSLTVSRARELTGLRTDTLRSKSPYPPYRDTILVITQNVFDYTKVAKFRFLEEWYIDENTSQIAKRVLGFSPLLEAFDSNNVLKGYTPLFWVYFDKKYPIKIVQKVPNNFRF